MILPRIIRPADASIVRALIEGRTPSVTAAALYRQRAILGTEKPAPRPVRDTPEADRA